MRHKYFYATFSRAFSKSFLSILCKLLQAILYPHSDLFVSAAGKEQSGSILTEKVSLICDLIPGIKNEINWAKGVTITNKDNVCYIFFNRSTLTVLTASERSRGQRKTGGVLEECASMDGKILNEVLIPTMCVNRPLSDGTFDKNGVINKSQCYITTAGFANTFAWIKMVS